MASESEQEKRDTLADIVAEIRRAVESMSDELPYAVSAVTVRKVADRIEAAWKREREELREAATAKMLEGATIIDNRGQGNAAALREAVVALLDAMDSLGCDEDTATLAALVPDMADSSAKCLAAFRKAKDALSAPPRQCDVGTPDEQAQRFEKFCKKSSMSGFGASAYCAHECACKDGSCCEFAWAQTPYEAEEGGAE